MTTNSNFKALSLLELIKSVPNAKQDWRVKSPLGKWCYFYSFGKVPLNLVRLAFIDEHMKKQQLIGYFMFTYFTGAIILSIYSMYDYFQRGDLQSGLVSTCMAAIMCGVRKQNKICHDSNHFIQVCITTYIIKFSLKITNIFSILFSITHLVCQW